MSEATSRLRKLVEHVQEQAVSLEDEQEELRGTGVRGELTELTIVVCLLALTIAASAVLIADEIGAIDNRG